MLWRSDNSLHSRVYIVSEVMDCMYELGLTGSAFWKPCWASVSMLWESSCFIMDLVTMCSSVLLAMKVRETGL